MCLLLRWVEPSDANLHVGTIVTDRYRIERLIGQGSFAWVFHAVGATGHNVALKVLHSSEPTARLRFAREVEVLRALPPNSSVVRYIDHGQIPSGLPFLALEFVDGITLKAGMMRCQRLAPPKAIAFMTELCGAFVGLHQLGVAHRDVKPENILLARAGGIKLIDFGLIRDAQGILKLLESDDQIDRRLFAEELDTHILVGTPEYMAPEQFSDASVADMALGRTDTWSDVFSLGVILYQLLAGQKPYPMREVPEEQYPNEMMRYMQWRIGLADHEFVSPPGVDRGLDSVLRKAMRQNPRQRQPDAKALLDDLVRYLDTGQGVLEADESHTCVVSINSILAAGRPNAPPAPAPSPAPAPRHRDLPPIIDDDPEEEPTTLTLEDASLLEDEAEEKPPRELPLIDEDSFPQGHTVVFFANDLESGGSSAASAAPPPAADEPPARPDLFASAKPPEAGGFDGMPPTSSPQPAPAAVRPEPRERRDLFADDGDLGELTFALDDDDPAIEVDIELDLPTDDPASWSSSGPTGSSPPTPWSPSGTQSSPPSDPRLEQPFPPEPRSSSSLAHHASSPVAPWQEEEIEDDWSDDAPTPPPVGSSRLEEYQYVGPSTMSQEPLASIIDQLPQEADQEHPTFSEDDEDETTMNDGGEQEATPAKPAARPVRTRQVNIRDILPRGTPRPPERPLSTDEGEVTRQVDVSDYRKLISAEDEVTRQVNIAEIMPDEVKDSSGNES